MKNLIVFMAVLALTLLVSAGITGSVMADTLEVQPVGGSTDIRYFDGLVGVGTALPGSKLEVNGGELNVVESGTDYGLVIGEKAGRRRFQYDPSASYFTLYGDDDGRGSLRIYNLYSEDIMTNGPWVDVRRYASFSAAIDAIGTNNKTLLIPNEQAVSANKTVPSNITLKFLQGGMLNISNTVTVTINGKVDAALHQIFKWTGTGTVILGYSSVIDIYPQWFGALGTNTDDTLALQKAISACRTTTDVFHRLVVPGGRYGVTAPLHVEGVSIIGSGAELYGTSFMVKQGFSGSHVLILDNAVKSATDGYYHNFSILGWESTDVVGGIKLKEFVYNNVFQNIRLAYITGDGITLTGSGDVPEMNTFIGVHVEAVSLGNGLTIEGGLNNTFIGCTWEGLKKSGINITSFDPPNSRVSAIEFINNWVEAVATVSGHAVNVQYGDAITFRGLRITNYGYAGGPASHGINLDTSYRCKIEAPDIAAVTAASSYKIKATGGTRHAFERLPSNILDADLSSTYVHSLNNNYQIVPNSKGQIFVQNGTAITGNSTVYIAPPLCISAAAVADGEMPVSGYLNAMELRAKSTTLPGGGGTYTITVMKNGVATGITTTLADGNGGVNSDTTHEAGFTPGDYISFKVVSSAAAVQIPIGALHITLGYMN